MTKKNVTNKQLCELSGFPCDEPLQFLTIDGDTKLGYEVPNFIGDQSGLFTFGRDYFNASEGWNYNRTEDMHSFLVMDVWADDIPARCNLAILPAPLKAAYDALPEGDN